MTTKIVVIYLIKRQKAFMCSFVKFSQHYEALIIIIIIVLYIRKWMLIKVNPMVPDT